jgi:tRNA/rRNA methyltransferase
MRPHKSDSPKTNSRPSKRPGPLSHFAVAIVEPEFGINIGYLARAAANFGIERLAIVSKNKLSAKEFSQALLFAAHGRYLFENLKYVTSIQSLKAEFKTLIGTTAIEATRKSNITRRTLGPEECAQTIYRQMGRFSKRKLVHCLVFGRDTTGLTNEELRECDYVVTIRTLSEYNTLNVSHAAAILFYLFSKTGAALEKSKTRPIAPASSTRKEKERLVSRLLKLAEDANFQSFKQDLLRQSLERLLNRSDPTLREVYLLMGLASKADSQIRRLSGHSATGTLAVE